MPAKTLLLVNPPQKGLMEGFAAGLISLANYVSMREPEVDVMLTDLGLSNPEHLDAEVAAILRGIDGEAVVGITTTTASYQSALRVARAAKRAAPGCMVVMGGHHASPEAEILLAHHAEVDCVIAGEGEIALLALVRRGWDSGKVPGLVRKGRLGILRAGPAPLLDQEALDSIAVTFRGNGLRSAPGKFDHVTYVSARGCPLRCAFCAVANEAIRAKSVDAIVRDLRCLVEQHGYERIAIEDNFFAQSAPRTLGLCAALSRLRATAPFTWDCQTRVESMKRGDILEAMERAGCAAVYLGVEALHPELLTYLGKTGSPDAYVRSLTEVVVPRMLESSVDCYLNLQFGIAVQTTAHRDLTLRVLGEMGCAARRAGKTITVFPQLAVLYPGTGHFQEALRQQRFGRGTREVFESFTEWESRQEPVLRWLGENFAHGTGGIPEGILDEGELRCGRFEVDGAAVLRVLDDLRTVGGLEGVRVFEYGRFLAGARAAHGRPAASPA